MTCETVTAFTLQVVISWESWFIADHLLHITVVTSEQLLSIPGKVRWFGTRT